MSQHSVINDLLSPPDASVLDVTTHGPGSEGQLPVAADELRDAPSGGLFASTQNIGMGRRAEEAGRKPFLILSASGGKWRHPGRLRIRC